MDAVAYMKSVYDKKEPNPYDLIIIDINNPDCSSGISPGPEFYSKEFLENIKVKNLTNCCVSLMQGKMRL